MSKRVCRHCPTIIPRDSYRGLCPPCRAAYDKQRGTSAERGYGANHQAHRRDAEAALQRGETLTCWRCGGPITRAADMHIGHDDDDRSITRGPEHTNCNLAAAGRKGAAQGPTTGRKVGSTRDLQQNTVRSSCGQQPGGRAA